MVKRTLTASLVLLIPQILTAAPRLVVECSKQSIFFGQTTTCQYTIYAPDEAIELEVVKFPEFKGFWSENIALKQGPMTLFRDPQATHRTGTEESNRYKALVGSYIIAPMLSDSEPVVEPMKVVVRRPYSFNAQAETSLESEPVTLRIQRLPQAPPELEGLFGGAVGEFQISAEFTEAVFSQDMPVSLRFYLRGEGNFHEIAEPKLALPEGVEMLTSRSWLQGSAQMPLKVFEYSLQARVDHDITLPAVDFVFFNPTTKAYEKLTTQPIRLRYTPSPNPDMLPDHNTPTPERSYLLTEPFYRQTLFWVFQALAAAILVSIWLWRRQPAAVTAAPRQHSAPDAESAEEPLKAACARLDNALTQPRSSGSDNLTTLGHLKSEVEKSLYGPNKLSSEQTSALVAEIDRALAELKS